jgi:hypothetical protein
MRISSYKAFFACAFLPLTLIATAGCSSGSKTVPVEGSVMLGDKLVEKGNITFHPDTAKGNTSGHVAVGSIEGGKYKLMTGKSAGAPPGAYKVTVSVSVPSNPKDEYSLPKLLIAEKFNDEKNTPLSADVKEGGGPYDFTVTK